MPSLTRWRPGGPPAPEVRRVVELVTAMPSVMSREEIQAWLKDGTRPEGEREKK